MNNMILLHTCVKELRSLPDEHTTTANSPLPTYNDSKSTCLAICKLAKASVEPLKLGTNLIEWLDSIEYFGVTIKGVRGLGFNDSPVKQSFFALCNCI